MLMIEAKRNCAILPLQDLAGLGGGQVSSINMLQAFDADWLVLSPFEKPEGIKAKWQTVDGGYKLPFINHRIASEAEAVQVTSYLQESNVEYVLLNHPNSLYAATLFTRLPQDIQNRTVAIWRCMVTDEVPQTILPPGRIKAALKPYLWKTIFALQRRLGNGVGLNLAVSHAVKDSLIDFGIDTDKIAVVPEQIGGEFTPELRLLYGPDLRKEYLADDEFGVLIVSRVSHEKGLDWVSQVYHHLRQMRKDLHPDTQYKKIKITLVGAINNRSLFNQIEHDVRVSAQKTCSVYAAESVSCEYVGAKTKAELQPYYSTYDVLVMPSPAEGFGRVTVEAMSSGMTVIGNSQCAATREILNLSATPTGMAVENSYQAAIEILRLMHDTSRMQELQANATQWANGYYSLTHAEEAFWQALDRI